MKINSLYISLFSALAFAFIANYIYEKRFFENDLQEYSQIINQIRDVDDAIDILYIGESSNNTFHGSDTDKRAISDMLGDWYPGMVVSDITYPASHAGIYKDLLNAIPKQKSINTVVVTLNLRSFNAQWIYSDLETQLRKSMVLLKPYPPLVNRFLLSFKAFNNDSKRTRKKKIRRKWKSDILEFPFPFQIDNTYDWDGYHWRHGGKLPDGSMDMALKDLACHYVKAYGFQIDVEHNPRIRDFNEIIMIAKERGWNLVFNLMAENTQKAEEIVGDELLYCMEYNRNVLCEYFRDRGVTVIDNFYIAPNEQFIDQDWTTEHYKDDTRWNIAQNLAAHLKPLFPDAYFDAEFDGEIVLCHDCEQLYGWGQEHTIVNTDAFSGSYASRVSENNPFSITLDYSVKEPDSPLKAIFSFSVFRIVNDMDDTFVIELFSGDEVDWNGLPLSSICDSLNVWESVLYDIVLPEGITRIRAFVHNPSGDDILVDDFCAEWQ